MDKRAVFCAGWAGARQATDLSSPEEREQTYTRWLEKEDEGVDPLALMLDGCRVFKFSTVSFDKDSIEALVDRPGECAMARALVNSEVAEVAQAVFELEAWADWQPATSTLRGPPTLLGDPAYVALKGSMESLGRRAPCQTIDYLEAAARLRDGWRPR